MNALTLKGKKKVTPHRRTPLIPRVMTRSAQSDNAANTRRYIQAKCACGGGCPMCQGSHRLQAKLKIGAPDDKYEQEADQVADQVMRMPDAEVQGKPG